MDAVTPAGPAAKAGIRSGDIVTKVDQIPFEEIGRRLNASLATADALLERLESEVAPAATDTLREARSTLDAAHRSLAAPDAPLQQPVVPSKVLLEYQVVAEGKNECLVVGPQAAQHVTRLGSLSLIGA